MKPEPIIALPHQPAADNSHLAASGQSFSVYEWKGSGPGYLHIHHKDDEAWHILEGTVQFRFKDKQIDATAGTTVFVPAGVPHDYKVLSENTRYLIILTPRLKALIDELHAVPFDKHQEVMRKYDSEIVT